MWLTSILADDLIRMEASGGWQPFLLRLKDYVQYNFTNVLFKMTMRYKSAKGTLIKRLSPSEPFVYHCVFF